MTLDELVPTLKGVNPTCPVCFRKEFRRIDVDETSKVTQVACIHCGLTFNFLDVPPVKITENHCSVCGNHSP